MPKGSQLQGVSGIDLSAVEVSEDLGYTVFSFVNGPVSAGESKEITIRYLLPFELSFSPEDSYQFIAENQAGAENVTLKKEIIIPESLSSDGFSLVPVVETELNKKQSFSTVLSR